MKNGMIESAVGKCWYKNDELHREDRDEKGLVLPAVEKTDGTKEWYKEGVLHREDRGEDGRVLPAIITVGHGMAWYKNGVLHREDRDETGMVLPAVKRVDGVSMWYKEGKCHRVCGPAIINGRGGQRWFLEGVEMKKEAHPWWIAQNEKKTLEGEFVNENGKEETGCKLKHCAVGVESAVIGEKENAIKTKKSLRI